MHDNRAEKASPPQSPIHRATVGGDRVRGAARRLGHSPQLSSLPFAVIVNSPPLRVESILLDMKLDDALEELVNSSRADFQPSCEMCTQPLRGLRGLRLRS